LTDAPEEKSLGRQAQWRRDNPEKYRAHLRVASAIRSGRIIKQQCKICGNPRTDAHHTDYRRPLKVTWLCRFHHAAVHTAKKGKA
jgi:hypothetical protein